MKICSITATCGRHQQLERCVSMLLNQDFDGEYTILIYNNSDVKLELDPVINNYKHKVILINNHLDLKTGKKYTNLGAIYRDALTFVPEDTEIITHSDDDDMYYSNHITEGVKGFLEAKKQFCVAYKPYYSYYMEGEKIKGKMFNYMEPSVFVDYNWILEKGYNENTKDQHMAWYSPILKNNLLYEPKEGISTLIYTWGNPIPTFKTSGNPGNPNNFNEYRKFSQDNGDLIITPKEVKLPIYGES